MWKVGPWSGLPIMLKSISSKISERDFPFLNSFRPFLSFFIPSEKNSLIWCNLRIDCEKSRYEENLYTDFSGVNPYCRGSFLQRKRYHEAGISRRQHVRFNFRI